MADFHEGILSVLPHFPVGSCDPLGHTIDADSYCEYPDGVIAARCTNCDVRITMERLPGGLPLIRARHMVAGLMASDSAYDMMAVSAIEEQLDLEQQKIDEIRSLLDLAKQIVNDRHFK